MKYYTVILYSKATGKLELLTPAADENEARCRAWRCIRFHKFRMGVARVLPDPIVTSTQAQISELVAAGWSKPAKVMV
jgi:hypothetical protein